MTGSGKVGLVTGAGSGIGRAVALRLLGAGYDVVLAGRRVQELEKTAAAADSGGGTASVVPVDVADPSSVANLFAELEKSHGRLDVLFNNAGISGPPVPLEDLTVDQWTAVVDVNLNGAFWCAQAAVRMMKAQMPKGGRIINNGSISAQAPRPLSAPYTATKHAITGLTKSIALDGRAHGIACSQIDIGNAATDMTASMEAGARQADGSIKPEARFDVGHVADAVLFMAELPLTANVPFMTLMATTMPLIGRG